MSFTDDHEERERENMDVDRTANKPQHGGSEMRAAPTGYEKDDAEDRGARSRSPSPR